MSAVSCCRSLATLNPCPSHLGHTWECGCRMNGYTCVSPNDKKGLLSVCEIYKRLEYVLGERNGGLSWRKAIQEAIAKNRIQVEDKQFGSSWTVR